MILNENKSLEILGGKIVVSIIHISANKGQGIEILQVRMQTRDLAEARIPDRLRLGIYQAGCSTVII